MSTPRPRRIPSVDEERHKFPPPVVFTEEGQTPACGKEKAQRTDGHIPLGTLRKLVDIWRGFEEHH
jgi:hypothetical protein